MFSISDIGVAAVTSGVQPSQTKTLRYPANRTVMPQEGNVTKPKCV